MIGSDTTEIKKKKSETENLSMQKNWRIERDEREREREINYRQINDHIAQTPRQIRKVATCAPIITQHTYIPSGRYSTRIRARVLWQVLRTTSRATNQIKYIHIKYIGSLEIFMMFHVIKSLLLNTV